MEKYYYAGASNKMFEQIDEQISMILSKVRSHAKGPKRNVLFSIDKIIFRARLLYWRVRIKLDI